jgi:hypothetical protein
MGALCACDGESLQGTMPGNGTTGPTSLGSPAASTVPAYTDSCWPASLPAEVQPMPPTASVADTCAATATATDWSYPQNPAGTSGDDRRYIVGRWVACSSSAAGTPPNRGIEFGANGRWRLLTVDATTGDFSPVSDGGTDSGYYYMLGIGQLDLTPEYLGGGTPATLVTFALGMAAVTFKTPGGAGMVYARATPSPLNGADNPPPTTDGACSLVGEWNVPSSSSIAGAPPAVFWFDAAGNFVVGGSGANLCDGRDSHGTYALSAGLFQLTSNVGLGCPWEYTATYSALFDPSCNQLMLTRQIDNCTGGRIFFNEPTTLTRR